MRNNFPGVRAKEHPTHFRGKKDVYFSIRYTRNGKQYEEGIGWKSEGYTAEKAYDMLCNLKRDIKAGNAISLKDQREQTQKAKEANAEALKQEQSKDITFSTLFEEHYTPFIKTKNKQSTYEREINLFKTWLEPFLGSLPLSRICRTSLISITQEMAKENLSNRSQHYAISLVRQVFNFAIDNDFFSNRNPASRVKLKKEDNRREAFLTENKLEELLNELKRRSYNMYLMALISAECGLRAGEIFNLTWGDIDFKRETFFLRDTKNGKNRHARISKRTKEKLSGLKKGEKNQFVFQSRTGGKIEHVSRTFTRAVDALELNKGITDRRHKIVFHSLRHTYASHLLQNGVSIFLVKELLGHSDIKMTLRYSHVSEENLRQAVATLDKRS